MKRKAQIRMFETIAVLLIFFFLLAIGLVFYARLRKSSLSEKHDESFELEAIETAQLISFLPELQCSNNNIVVDDCFDTLKLDAFAEMVAGDEELKNEYYYSIMGYSIITIEEIYPDPGSERWEIYKKEPASTKTKLSFQIPVLLYDPLERSYSFGVMNLEVYQP